MSEQIHDQVSAFMDDELSNEECAFLVRRFERDPDARTKLVRYSLIGSALRGDLLQPDPQTLRRRLHEALNGASPPARTGAAAAQPGRAGSRERWANPAVGLGIAASVAVAALFTIRAMNDVGGGAEQPLGARASAAAPSYVVPADGQESISVSSPLPIRLTNYLLQHSEYAHRLSRTSVHSNVVGATDVPMVTEAAVVIDDAASQQREREAR